MIFWEDEELPRYLYINQYFNILISKLHSVLLHFHIIFKLIDINYQLIPETNQKATVK
jgi:hypothetical protein